MQQPQAVVPPSAPLSLRTLGSLGLYRGGEDIAVVPAGKPLALLVYLSALPGRRANREHLLNLLWADLEPASARHALRQTVWYLRQRLGDDALSMDDDDVSLTTPIETDRERFLTAIESGRLADAVEIYRGEFLPGFAVPGGLAFEHWSESERSRLQLLFRHAAETLSRQEIGQGHFRAARELARRVRDTDPFEESGWRLLIEACLAQDDRVSALTEGQRLQQLLAAEERTPEPATQALLRRANAQPEDTPHAENGMLVAELVGRERAFAALVAAFQEARQGSARVVSVVAPAGLGKTRLLLDLSRRLAAGGTTAVYVRAQPGDRDIPGSYVAEVARQLASRPGSRGVSPASASSLVALDPSISGQFPALPDISTGDEARRHRVVAMAELIQAVAEEHAFALLLDDLHWADSYSRDALEHALSRIRPSHILVVLASRPGGAPRGVEGDQTISLEPLTTQQIEALLASLGTLPEEPWARDLPAFLQAAGEGSPLLVLETLQLALETAALARGKGVWSCPDEPALLSSLKAGSALGRRISDLDRQQGWLLLLLALAGTPLAGDTLARASGQDPDALHVGLHALESRGLVARQGNEWSVAHDEIAARAEELATPAQVTAGHTALGKTLLDASRDAAGLRAAVRHLALTPEEGQLTRVATAWVRRCRREGDRRPTRSLVAELLAADGDDPRVRQLLASLPRRVRAGPAGRWAALATGAVAAIGLLAAALLRSGPAEPGVTIAIWSQEPGGQWRMLSHQLTESDLARGSVPLASFQRSRILNPNRQEGVLRPGAPGTVATTVAYADSGGLDVALAHAGNEPALRLTARAGDDYARAWSPDGRLLVIVTDR